MPKVIYVATPYTTDDPFQRQGWLDACKIAVHELWRSGLVAVAPVLITNHMDGQLPYNIFIEGDCLLLGRCDALLLLSGWQHSKGCSYEKAFAEQRWIPVFTEIEGLLKWAKTK